MKDWCIIYIYFLQMNKNIVMTQPVANEVRKTRFIFVHFEMLKTNYLWVLDSFTFNKS